MIGSTFTKAQLEQLAKFGYSIDEGTKQLQAPGVPQTVIAQPGSYIAVEPPHIAIDKNVQNRRSTRFNPELAASIAESGVQVPVEVMVSGDRYIVVSGHHRVTHALLVSPDKPIPVFVGPARTIAQAAVRQNRDNRVRLEETPLDRVYGMNHLRVVAKLKLDEIGSLYRGADGQPLKSPEITRLLKILTWPTPVQAAYDAGMRESVAAMLSTLDQAHAERALTMAADNARERLKASKDAEGFSGVRRIKADDVVKALADLKAPVRPRIKFTATPASIVEGNGTMLTWDVNFADKLALSTDEGKTWGELDALKDAKKEITLSPAVDTIYVLRATNEAGESQARVKVVVRPKPAEVTPRDPKLPDGSDKKPEDFVPDGVPQTTDNAVAVAETQKAVADLKGEIGELSAKLETAQKGANDASSVAAFSAEIANKQKMLADAEKAATAATAAPPVVTPKPSDSAKLAGTPILSVGELQKVFTNLALQHPADCPLFNVFMTVPRLITGQATVDAVRTTVLTFADAMTDSARRELREEIAKEYAARVDELRAKVRQLEAELKSAESQVSTLTIAKVDAEAKVEKLTKGKSHKLTA